MITEDYISFELAKLLKEKGFDGECIGYYWDMDKTFGIHYELLSYSNGNLRNELILAPTLQMAMKWLREAFKIHCQITYTLLASGWIYDIHNLNKDEWWVTTFGNTDTYDTYEEAAESAIKYVLENLI